MSCNKCSRIQHVTPTQTSTPVQKTIPSSPQVSSGGVTIATGKSTSHHVTSLDQVSIPPSESPTLDVIRSQDFTSTLVSIPDAAVVKNLCKEPVQELIECPDCDNTPANPTCLDPKASCSTESQGHDLGYCFTDAKPVQKMTLLGRVGRFLAKLTGEGVLWMDKNGEVSIKKFLPFRTSHLWHKWYKPTSNSAPLIGNPMDYPYKVITDLDGNPFTIMGLPNEDSIEVWNHELQEYQQKPISDFPTCVSSKLSPSAGDFELVGFDALGQNDVSTMRRCLKRIEGEGILCFTKVQTAPSEICECDSCDSAGQVSDTTTVARFIPYPTTECSDDSPFVLTYTPGGGCPTWQQTSTLDSLKGATGATGEAGKDGQDGQDAVVTTYNNCT